MERRSVSLAALSLVAGVACTGAIGGNGPEAKRGVAPPSASPSPPESTPTSSAPPELVRPTDCPAGRGETPPAAQLRRLTVDEYARTVTAIFGEVRGLVTGFPDDNAIDGFFNHVDTQAVTATHAERYLGAAQRITEVAFAAPDKALVTIGCDPTAAGCLDGYVDRMGRRLFRRPLLAEEGAALRAIAREAAGDGDPLAPFAIATQAMLQAPTFLYRFEKEPPADGAPRRLDGYEIASRLAFLLTGAGPDEALLDAAARGQLEDPAGIERTARVLLDGPSVHVATRSFAAQWLRLSLLDGIMRPIHPYWSDIESPPALAEETTRFAEEVLLGSGTSVLDLLTARFTFLTPLAAKVYDMTVPGKGASRVDLTNVEGRGGLLTHASFLAMTASSEVAAPILRGKYVREVLLCQRVPAPPAGVPDPDPTLDGRPLRERLALHRDNPACAGCHSFFDPIGLGLARYNNIGRYHANDAQGMPIDQQGHLEGHPRKADFEGALELEALLREDPATTACVATQLFRFAFGRTETAGDACLLRRMDETLRGGHDDFRSLLLSLVTSDSFRLVGGGR